MFPMAAFYFAGLVLVTYTTRHGPNPGAPRTTPDWQSQLQRILRAHTKRRPRSKARAHSQPPASAPLSQSRSSSRQAAPGESPIGSAASGGASDRSPLADSGVRAPASPKPARQPSCGHHRRPCSTTSASSSSSPPCRVLYPSRRWSPAPRPPPARRSSPTRCTRT